MADRGPPAPQSSPVIPLVQPVVLPTTTAQPVVPTPQPGLLPCLNWLHFKPEFAYKPDEDAEGHFLRTTNCIDTHAFQKGVKVKRFCLILEGEAILW